ncbi:Uncharacterized protein Rs2_40164 [Raphanus sativus]|nr:Uncharacterized protein Rs2_40164 [Raphanus sativus]
MSQYKDHKYRGDSSRSARDRTQNEADIIKEETYWSIGKAVGSADKVDVDRKCLRVSINGDEPIHVERKIGFSNGDVVSVTLKYEDLHRYCFTCKRISHEEGTCPELNDDQRERNRITRLEAKEKEEIANREAFSLPHLRKEGRSLSPRHERSRPITQKESDLRYQTRMSRSDFSKANQDLRHSISEKRDILSKNVWKRLDNGSNGNYPRDRERYHPYQNRREYPIYRAERQNSPLEWRAKSPIDQSRRSETGNSYKRNGSPPDSQRTVSDTMGRTRNSERYRAREQERAGETISTT